MSAGVLPIRAEPYRPRAAWGDLVRSDVPLTLPPEGLLVLRPRLRACELSARTFFFAIPIGLVLDTAFGSMRGTDCDHVKVLIDGIDVSDPQQYQPRLRFRAADHEGIAQIEILRGPQSGLYAVLGGVIAITSEKGEGPPKIRATVEGGSFGTFNQTSSASGFEGNFNYALNIGHFHSADTPVTPLDLLPPGRVRYGDYYDNLTYGTKLDWDATRYISFNVIARYTDATLRFTGDDFSTFPPAPAAVQSIQTVHQLYTRGETVVTLFDGAFKNYFDASGSR